MKSIPKPVAAVVRCKKPIPTGTPTFETFDLKDTCSVACCERVESELRLDPQYEAVAKKSPRVIDIDSVATRRYWQRVA